MRSAKWMFIACVVGSAAFAAAAAAADEKPAGGKPASPPPARAAETHEYRVSDAATTTFDVSLVGDELTLQDDSPAANARAGDAFRLVASRPGEPVKGTYLGVGTSPAQPALQKQLQLKPGVGLVVDGVEPGSPAEQAGVKEFDILHKLDEQLLVNTEQLAVLVRTYAPGKEVTLTVIREGQPQQLKAKLTERDLQPLQVMFHDAFGATPVRGHIGYITTNSPRVVETTVAVPDGGKLLTGRAARGGNVGGGAAGMIRIKSPDGSQTLTAARVTIENDRHTMTVSNQDGRKHLEVKDKSGKVVFEGPITTKEEMEKIPAELRQAYTDILLDHSKDVEPAPAPKATTPGTEPVDRR